MPTIVHDKPSDEVLMNVFGTTTPEPIVSGLGAIALDFEIE